eukprot:5314640-Pleurochrysis_carterae.AAC.1
MLRGELPYAALALAPNESGGHSADCGCGFRDRGDMSTSGLRAQVEHENKIKQEAREALVRDYANRIASILATAMRPKAGLKLRELQHTHGLLMYPSMYDGVE